MIQEDYVSFETAKLLKEKGFDEKCRTYYKAFPESRIAAIYHSSENRGVSEDDPNEILCPTHQMAMKWLREEHKIIPIILTGEYSQKPLYYWFRIDAIIEGKLKDAIYREDEMEFPTYEEACEAACIYALKNLI